MTKTDIHSACIDLISSRINDIQSSMKTVHESMIGEDKSSAGDKYETARAMAQTELAQLSDQANLLSHDFTMISRLNPLAVPDSVQTGSLIQTNKRWIYIAVGLGRLMVKETTVFSISPSSPLAQVFLSKQKGDKVAFNGMEEDILNLL